MSEEPQGQEGPEQERSASPYFARRDLKILIGGALLLLALLTPIYLMLKRQAERHVCSSNLAAIATALGTYSELFDDRFPPAFAEAKTDTPLLDEGARPFTWASLLSEHLSSRASFRCPSARQEELATSQHPTRVGRGIWTSYGIFAPIAGRPRSQVDTPGASVVLAESTNGGAAKTFDPLPLLDLAGRPTWDGFLLGFQDGNRLPSERSEFITRLAFPNSNGPSFRRDGPSRHDMGIFVLFADGRRGVITPPEAKVTRAAGKITGYWAGR